MKRQPEDMTDRELLIALAYSQRMLSWGIMVLLALLAALAMKAS